MFVCVFLWLRTVARYIFKHFYCAYVRRLAVSGCRSAQRSTFLLLLNRQQHHKRTSNHVFYSLFRLDLFVGFRIRLVSGWWWMEMIIILLIIYYVWIFPHRNVRLWPNFQFNIDVWVVWKTIKDKTVHLSSRSAIAIWIWIQRYRRYTRIGFLLSFFNEIIAIEGWSDSARSYRMNWLKIKIETEVRGSQIKLTHERRNNEYRPNE